MIPEFPKFKKLEFSDREEIVKHASRFVPYSDFSFTSMWSWNVESKIAISNIYGNLAVQFTDYETRKPFLSFMGVININQTCADLLGFAQQKNMINILKLIPEDSAKLINGEKFHLSSPRHSHDYILSTELIASYNHKKLYSKRKHVKQFTSNYNYRVDRKSLSDLGFQREMVVCMDIWRENKKQNQKYYSEIELEAIRRLLSLHLEVDCCEVLGLYIDDILRAFYIVEIFNERWAIAHFEKADNSFIGITEFMKQQVGKFLFDKRIHFLNIEQDLGLSDLREAKRRYLPVNYLKKYHVASI